MSVQRFDDELRKAVSEPQTGSALVATAEPGSTLARRFRHNAPLVTQLLAAKLDLPQARARRRAGPAEGISAYDAAGDSITAGRRRRGASWAA